jgi:hypothetical protein
MQQQRREKALKAKVRIAKGLMAPGLTKAIEHAKSGK